MNIDPRRLLPAVHRMSTSALPSADNDDGRALVAAAQPELEYESVSVATMTSSSDHSRLAIADARSKDRACAEGPRICGGTKDHAALLASFLVLVLSGTARSVFSKLQALPLYNYPTFINLFSNLLMVLLCFAYIVPAAMHFQCLPVALPSPGPSLAKVPLAVIGVLDGAAATAHVLASVYLPGSLVVLLPQGAVPFSILLSRVLLRQRFNWTHYAGAATVLFGLVVAVMPFLCGTYANEYYCEAFDEEASCRLCQREVTEDACLSHGGWYPPPLSAATAAVIQRLLEGRENTTCQWIPMDVAKRRDEALVVVWSAAMITSALFATLSTIYKEVAFRDEVDLNPITLMGWTSLFQLMFSALAAMPSALLASPSVPPPSLPRNLWNGLQCYLGKNSVATGCHPDELCSTQAALFFNLGLLSNVLYALSILLVVKYGGSTTLLFAAVTLVVPLAHLSFALPVVPTTTVVTHGNDILGLLIIVIGLVLYHFIAAGAEEKAGFVAGASAHGSMEVGVSDPDWPPQNLLVFHQPLLFGDV